MVEYLKDAPRIVSEQAPMSWMFLPLPQDGDVMLVWQPPQTGINAASDGYVWADAETAFQQEMSGYVSQAAMSSWALIDDGPRKWRCTCTEADTVRRMNLSLLTLGGAFV